MVRGWYHWYFNPQSSLTSKVTRLKTYTQHSNVYVKLVRIYVCYSWFSCMKEGEAQMKNTVETKRNLRIKVKSYEKEIVGGHALLSVICEQ